MVSLFFFGFAQPWAYVGMVRPFLTEVVNPQVIGLTTSMLSLFESTVGPLVSEYAIAKTSAYFGYEEPLFDMVQMDAATRASNGAALAQTIVWTDTIMQVLMLVSLGALYLTYPMDKATVEDEKSSFVKLF